MNRKIYFGKNDLRFFYYRYKDSSYYSLSIMVLSITVCIILIFSVIIPQVEKYISISREVSIEQEKLDILSKNINFVNNLDKTILESQFETAIQALPLDKDFIYILTSLSEVALESGVTLGDFSFNLKKQNSSNSNSSVNLDIRINGNIERIKFFLKEINQKLPIVEVEDINSNINSSFINLKFYYKAYPDLDFNENKSLVSISDENKKLIYTLSTWKTTNILIPDEELSIPSASSSVVPLFE